MLDYNTYQYSSKTMPRKTLASIATSKIERFLEWLANLKQEDEAAAVHFARRFEDMLKDVPSAKELFQWGRPNDFGRPEALEFLRISQLSSSVRSIWRGPTANEKQFRALMLQGTLSKANPTFLLTPELFSPGPFSQAILHLLRSADRALICLNSDCSTPYFLRKGKRQRYCSEKCAEVGQRQAKRKWWAEHGERWREKRPKKNRKGFKRKEQK